MKQTKEALLAVPVMLNIFQISFFLHTLSLGWENEIRQAEIPQGIQRNGLQWPPGSYWQNTQKKNKFLCKETVRGLNGSGLRDMEPLKTRSPALICPRLMVTESLSKLSSLLVYLKEGMATAQQIPVGRDLSQHGLGM